MHSAHNQPSCQIWIKMLSIASRNASSLSLISRLSSVLTDDVQPKDLAELGTGGDLALVGTLVLILGKRQPKRPVADDAVVAVVSAVVVVIGLAVGEELEAVVGVDLDITDVEDLPV